MLGRSNVDSWRRSAGYDGRGCKREGCSAGDAIVQRIGSLKLAFFVRVKDAEIAGGMDGDSGSGLFDVVGMKPCG